MLINIVVVIIGTIIIRYVWYRGYGYKLIP
jgi:hypothetical protein